jgi:hypothetical protein
VNAFPQHAAPDRLFYRGLGYGLVCATVIWAAVAAIVLYFV